MTKVRVDQIGYELTRVRVDLERTASDLQGHVHSEEEEEYGEEESVFSTLTLHKGFELANRVKRATFLLGDKSIPSKETEQKVITNSDNSCRSSSSNGQPITSNGCLEESRFKVTQVNLSAESQLQRRGTGINLTSESPLQRRGTGINLSAESTLPNHGIGVYLSAEPPLLRRGTGVNLLAEAPVPRSVTPVDFHHVEGTYPSKKDQVLDKFLDMDQDKFITGPSPVTLYVGSKRAICHLVREQRPLCCLEWGLNCSHCTYKNTNDQRWTNQLIILSAEKACNGIYNFIVPLRSQFIGMKSLCPIILLLGEKPERMFLETVSFFPLVYWMLGTITSVDDLLMAGINKASHLVVANKEMVQSVCEDTLADSETIVAVQTVFKLFPKVNILTELKQASNMRFMHFRAHDEYSKKISDIDRKLKSRIMSNTSHIFCLPFASGQVFSASMLDTLLYQTYVKGYLITFVRLLLGMDAENNSGHLSSIRITRATLEQFKTYGELYRALCSTTGEIPVALYRTERQSNDKPFGTAATRFSFQNNNKPDKSSMAKGKNGHHNQHDIRKASMWHIQKKWNNQNPEHKDIYDLIRNRMKCLELSVNDYCDDEYEKNVISYVILNPSPRKKLRKGDLVYVIQPSSMLAIPSRLNRTKQKRANLKRSGSDTDLNKPLNIGNTLPRERTYSLTTNLF
ncbi:hypothetical protein DPMN_073700 [Dreissena polymorpha]|uniref:RCK N-terminal domain-containing protein n=1 Tax=Dreissena polymorpha TaxID=45954 RepID=A0A9D4BZN2_DREPO|nr:hypothetical protein DPMN_073700 [Dreissena polymorpha]